MLSSAHSRSTVAYVRHSQSLKMTSWDSPMLSDDRKEGTRKKYVAVRLNCSSKRGEISRISAQETCLGDLVTADFDRRSRSPTSSPKA